MDPARIVAESLTSRLGIREQHRSQTDSCTAANIHLQCDRTIPDADGCEGGSPSHTLGMVRGNDYSSRDQAPDLFSQLFRGVVTTPPQVL
jgi:hypothetical protein